MSVICDECDLHICITNPELNLCHPDMTIRSKLRFLDENRDLTREQIIEKYSVSYKGDNHGKEKLS